MSTAVGDVGDPLFTPHWVMVGIATLALLYALARLILDCVQSAPVTDSEEELKQEEGGNEEEMDATRADNEVLLATVEADACDFLSNDILSELFQRYDLGVPLCAFMIFSM